MKRKPKRPLAIWTQAYPEQVTPNRAVLAGRRKARYAQKARAFKRKYPFCTLCWVRPTQDVHHLAGRRGDRLLDDTKWIALCRLCHDWIHANPKLAKQRGLMLSRA